MNRTLLFAALTTLCAALPTDEVLTWRVAKGTTLTRIFESTIHAELKSLSVSVDGEQQDTGPAVEMSIGHDFNYEFSDSIEAAQDGGPAKFLRKFTKISGTRARSLKAPE